MEGSQHLQSQHHQQSRERRQPRHGQGMASVAQLRIAVDNVDLPAHVAVRKGIIVYCVGPRDIRRNLKQRRRLVAADIDQAAIEFLECREIVIQATVVVIRIAGQAERTRSCGLGSTTTRKLYASKNANFALFGIRQSIVAALRIIRYDQWMVVLRRMRIVAAAHLKGVRQAPLQIQFRYHIAIDVPGQAA